MNTTKTFFAGLGQTKELTNFIQNDNLIDFSILNIEKHKGGIVTFMTITDFHKIENHRLDKAGQKSFELFQTFKNSKNAIACILKAIETEIPSTIDAETFKAQSKLTPATYTNKEKSLKTFGDFWNFLTPEQKISFGIVADTWMVTEGFETTNFDFFYTNDGKGGAILTKGQFIRITDSVYGKRIFAMVTQASPNGFVSVMDGEEIFTLSKETASKMRLLTPEELPAEALEFFNATFKELEEDLSMSKTKKIEAGIIAKDKKDVSDKIQLEKDTKLKEIQEKAKIDGIASAKEFKILDALKLETTEEIAKIVNMINADGSNLITADKKALSEKIKTAKLAIKTKAEALKATDKEKADKLKEDKKTATATPPAGTEPAPAMEPATEPKAEAEPKAPARPKRTPKAEPMEPATGTEPKA